MGLTFPPGRDRTSFGSKKICGVEKPPWPTASGKRTSKETSQYLTPLVKYIFRIKAAKNAAQQNINSNKTKAVKV